MKKNVFVLFVAFCFSFTSSQKEKVYLSPGPLVVSDDGRTVYTALTSSGAIAVTDLSTGETTGKIETGQNPNGILLSRDGRTLWAATGEARGAVEMISLPQNRVIKRIKVGHTPSGMALTPDGQTLYVANRFSNTIAVIGTISGKLAAEIPVIREPGTITASPDGTMLAVGNTLPAQALINETVAAEISLIDTKINRVSAQITLPNGSQSVRGVAFSPDGQYLYAVHLLSRFNVPITQIDRGWVNTNALSIIDVKEKSCYATVLLDDIDRGAANPAGIGIGGDGNLYIAIAGCHELMRIDLEEMHDRLERLFSGTFSDPYIKNRDDLSISLSFAYPFKSRIALSGRLPQHLAFTNDAVLVSSRFSPFIEKINLLMDQKSGTASVSSRNREKKSDSPTSEMIANFVLKDHIVPPGFTVEFFNNERMEGEPVYKGTVPVIHYPNENQRPVASNVPVVYFSSRFQGEFVAPQTGTLLFALAIDDSYRFLINEQVVAQSTDNGSFFCPVQVVKDEKYRLQLEHAQRGGYYRIELSASYDNRYSSTGKKIRQIEQKPVQIQLGTEPELDSYRRGELAFNDATLCFQQWHTCASCHPDGRADGLNWDQQNDGFGNPKNTKSLLFSHVTPPSMITGIRESAEKAVRAGIMHTLFSVQPESLAADMDEYLKNMPVQESPYLSKASKKDLDSGKKLFEKAGCAQCHKGLYYTDLQKYNVGTGDGDDLNRPFDTPTLREVWRTAPYLYDGRAATLEEIFTKFNRGDRHGITSNLSSKELKELVLYLKTL